MNKSNNERKKKKKKTKKIFKIKNKIRFKKNDLLISLDT